MHRRNFLSLAAATAGLGFTSAALAQASAGVAPGSLGGLKAVTIPAPDLARIEAAYADHLGYQTVWRGTVPKATARAWNAPAVAGKRVVVMAAEVEAPVYLRFVEQPLPKDFRPLTTFGWQAAEILVQDPDALAARLAGSPFQIIGPPQTLVGWENSKAMQVVGPAGEVLYFTHFAPDPKQPDRWRQPKLFVENTFVVVAGTSDMEGGVGWFDKSFGNKAFGEFSIENKIISDANRLPASTKHRLNTVRLTNHAMVEIDAFPANATRRTTPKGGLAPGVAIVTFAYDKLDRPDLVWMGDAPSLEPLKGRTRTLMGPGGALLEFIQA